MAKEITTTEDSLHGLLAGLRELKTAEPGSVLHDHSKAEDVDGTVVDLHATYELHDDGDVTVTFRKGADEEEYHSFTAPIDEGIQSLEADIEMQAVLAQLFAGNDD